ncbi:hypothetical protein AX774_g1461 [Zancudomyces culisetae]|uniref:Uncharacterized protein n=1 Tax=Zancudomyces culisetae TaxID=1213189 RepID=A0A1R1PVT3_ZANCU|nr:hypothetical protein AX774_g1461 [Zancudomyces culisetae]|eukprot:OMH85012.1 hypothetical protein AX774_g1461 [Zancudomyces culisetae]
MRTIVAQKWRLSSLVPDMLILPRGISCSSAIFTSNNFCLALSSSILAASSLAFRSATAAASLAACSRYSITLRLTSWKNFTRTLATLNLCTISFAHQF